jgi:hypothetical protein
MGTSAPVELKLDPFTTRNKDEKNQKKNSDQYKITRAERYNNSSTGIEGRIIILVLIFKNSTALPSEEKGGPSKDTNRKIKEK